ncbi:RNA polymerase II transcription factor B subunit 4 [Serendipita sp. 396]|nr:RNA polymerase II transcription factor B subunit 4 [Serendipita sp. 396]KAG8786832.1 RNA polymerase II transcription factor B subunit 4 [Serendipita sp. 397]KAG8845179.1 RNA polymerase II transcription factor B subunit 4 [Serendipita sp. 411]KAG8871669.1 RNA polymerase II transcription factor B subunit 4 [Serendipita sp. 405]
MDNAIHLSVIIDFSPSQWYLSSEQTADQSSFSLADFLPQLFVFLNAHLALQYENTLDVFGAFPGKSLVLFSSKESYVQTESDSNVYQPFKTANSVISQRLADALDSLPEDVEEPVAIVGALTKSLCYISRLLNSSPDVNASSNNSNSISSRILIISVSPDVSASYVPIMNSIFCAQKLKIIVDVCNLYGSDTVFLQQAAHLTGGSYISVQKRDRLLQYLMTTFLSAPSVRRLLAVPTEDKVDLRAACFCHKKIVDIGFVCSVCLSIFCKPTPVCSTCRVKFPIKTLQRLKEAANPVAPPNIPPPSIAAELAPKPPLQPKYPMMLPGMSMPMHMPMYPPMKKGGQHPRPVMKMPPNL